jgi:hypothetical protein
VVSPRIAVTPVARGGAAAARGGAAVADHAAEPPSRLERLDAYYTWDEAAQAWYFAPRHRADPPYKEQIRADATIDLASDGTMAGIEIHDPRRLQECHARIDGRIKAILADSPSVPERPL